MTNKEYLEQKGTCIHTGDIGMMESVIRMRCIISGIDFDDDMIESWLNKIIPVYERKRIISVADIIRLSIGDEHVWFKDHVHGFEMFDPNRIQERL